MEINYPVPTILFLKIYLNLLFILRIYLHGHCGFFLSWIKKILFLVNLTVEFEVNALY
jgi:hypothetical protein